MRTCNQNRRKKFSQVWCTEKERGGVQQDCDVLNTTQTAHKRLRSVFEGSTGVLGRFSFNEVE